MIYLLGIGWSKDDVSQGALKIIKGSRLFIDRYTSFLSDELVEWLGKQAGKKPVFLQRSEMEEGARGLVALGKNSNIAIVVGGDPLMATTHKILLIEAKKQKVALEVVHAPSILSVAMGESGLDFYRFGRIFTIPGWSEHYRPVSFYETLSTNLRNNMHTLALLDYDQKSMRTIPLESALSILESAEAKYREGIVGEHTKLFVLHNLCLPGQRKLFLELGEAKGLRFKEGVTTIVIPAKLSDIERETVDAMYGA